MINQIRPINSAFIEFTSNHRREYSEEIIQLFNDVLKRDSDEIQEEASELAINEGNNKYEEILIRDNLVGFIIWKKESARDSLGIPHLVIINSKINLVSKSIDALVCKFFKHAETNKAHEVCFNIEVNNSDFISFLERNYSSLTIPKEDAISLKSTRIMKRELYYAVPKKSEKRFAHSIEASHIKSGTEMSPRITPHNTAPRAMTALRSMNRNCSDTKERGETPARQRPSPIEEKERSQSSLRNKRAYSVDKRSAQRREETNTNKAPRR